KAERAGGERQETGFAAEREIDQRANRKEHRRDNEGSAPVEFGGKSEIDRPGDGGPRRNAQWQAAEFAKQPPSAYSGPGGGQGGRLRRSRRHGPCFRWCRRVAQSRDRQRKR